MKNAAQRVADMPTGTWHGRRAEGYGYKDTDTQPTRYKYVAHIQRHSSAVA